MINRMTSPKRAGLRETWVVWLWFESIDMGSSFSRENPTVVSKLSPLKPVLTVWICFRFEWICLSLVASQLVCASIQ